MLDFWLRFDQLAKARGLINKEIYTQAGIAPNTFSQWRLNDRIPPADRAQALAHVLDTTVEYLVTGQSTLPMASSSNLPILKPQLSSGTQEQWQEAINIAGYLDIFRLEDKAIKQYAFVASGSSMLGVGIAEGDYIIFTPHNAQERLHDGLYLFAIDEVVYCKRLEFDLLADTIKIFNMRSTDPKEAELVRTLTGIHSQPNVRLLGRVTGCYHVHSHN
ncbi:XRE family transcriptional regulator [Entomospira culicis]|uniref:LexA family transcriptional regulator n=1 Tax=Entomospira culicis TaxID=2719989 RepID=A0A968GK43_9SPIO|nr:helix-turn-helix transcriptional regulator [Entomospira culicis]NIZ19111.1 LexA family transcriptional regulator [Entomospira culicis]NIZ69325.1 LexA family transcriptional regulator [Entomospira culicis]WDI37911.1 helix-turn-helix transcriptional regulator [Entomospira culicis]WDI39538.1 helix-turn-helix transcriptional regulator [Entomospira culicis]